MDLPATQETALVTHMVTTVASPMALMATGGAILMALGTMAA